MTRHRAIIKRLGGYVALADRLGLDVETVKSWNKADRGIPPRYWVQIARLADLTPEYLQRTSPRPHAARRRVAAE
jgi:DNA-binding transcriptional regulator YdaS (Cro superfamily)